MSAVAVLHITNYVHVHVVHIPPVAQQLKNYLIDFVLNSRLRYNFVRLHTARVSIPVFISKIAYVVKKVFWLYRVRK